MKQPQLVDLPPIESIARAAHEANRAYCRALGDMSHASWDDAPEWQKESARKGVCFYLDNPDASPRLAHSNWFKDKLKDGWVYGNVKDIEKKTHPCLVPYDTLPEYQRAKDHIFAAVVRGALDRVNSRLRPDESAVLPIDNETIREALGILRLHGRQIWGAKKHTLDEIVVRLMVGVGDLARLARNGKPNAYQAVVGDVAAIDTRVLDEWTFELKKELGNIIFSTIRWIDDLGLDPIECLESAISAQEKFAQSGQPR